MLGCLRTLVTVVILLGKCENKLVEQACELHAMLLASHTAIAAPLKTSDT